MHRPRHSCHKKRKPCFFKFYFPDVTDEQLQVPIAFLKHMDGEYCGTVILKGPSGKIWHLNMIEESGGVFLKSGWKQFVDDNAIQIGYCLVFKYYGNLRFTVKIFDTSACQTIDLSHERCNNDKEENIMAMKGNGILNTTTSLHIACGGNVVHQHPTDVVVRSFSKKSEELGKKNLKSALPETETSLSSEKKAGEKRRRKPNAKSSSKLYFSQRRPVTKVEIERAFEAATSFRSRHPSAAVVMRKSYVYYGFYMSLPKAFTRSSMPKASLPITLLDPIGKEWKAKYNYKNTGGGAISAGWVSFTVANNIEEDDVCVFELVASGKMQVHIFRVVDEITPLLLKSRKKHA